jgi:hypothetical protein
MTIAHFWFQVVTLAPQFRYSTTTQGSPTSTGPTSCLCNSGQPWKLHQPSNQSALKCISICCFPCPAIGSRSHLRVSMWPHLTSLANNLVTWRVSAPRLPLFVVLSAGVRETGMTFRVREMYDMCPALSLESATATCGTRRYRATLSSWWEDTQIRRHMSPTLVCEHPELVQLSITSTLVLQLTKIEQGNKAQHSKGRLGCILRYVLSDGSHGQARLYHLPLTSCL